mmetsp:Transcript_28650/g.73160  ORF Transcript_28650/g.73160 Transcript_28650/m.73160 type:complete len:714 (-) Transcript_28650:735-2876(-)
MGCGVSKKQHQSNDGFISVNPGNEPRVDRSKLPLPHEISDMRRKKEEEAAVAKQSESYTSATSDNKKTPSLEVDVGVGRSESDESKGPPSRDRVSPSALSIAVPTSVLDGGTGSKSVTFGGTYSTGTRDFESATTFESSRGSFRDAIAVDESSPVTAQDESLHRVSVAGPDAEKLVAHRPMSIEFLRLERNMSDKSPVRSPPLANDPKLKRWTTDNPGRGSSLFKQLRPNLLLTGSGLKMRDDNDIYMDMKREEARKREKLELFKSDCTEVYSRVHVAGDDIAQNLLALKQTGITHVVNCAARTSKNYFENELEYLALYLNDSPSCDLFSVLYPAITFMEKALADPNARVLVHCTQGVSRSASIAIAYMLTKDRLSYDQALEYVRERRGICRPNLGFEVQLKSWSKRLKFSSEPRRDSSSSHTSDPGGRIDMMFRIAPHDSDFNPFVPAMKLVEKPGPSDLDARGVFLVETPLRGVLYVWKGVDAVAELCAAALRFAENVRRYERPRAYAMSEEYIIEEVEQGSETDEFWDAIVMKDDIPARNVKYDRDIAVAKWVTWDAAENPRRVAEMRQEKDRAEAEAFGTPTKAKQGGGEADDGEEMEEEKEEKPTAKLFELKRGVTGKEAYVEYDNYDEDDLWSDRIFVLLPQSDTTKLYVWFGSDVGVPESGTFDDYASKVAKEFEAHFPEASNREVMVEEEEKESEEFDSYFFGSE